MSSQDASSCSCHPETSRSHGSAGSHNRALRWAPECDCGDRAMVRTASTKKNYGKKFWGCKNFRYTNNHGCDFFDWYYEGVTSEKDQTIMRQRDKMGELRNNVDELKKKLDEATSALVAQNHTIEAQNGRIASLENKLTSTRKWSCILGVVCAVLLLTLVWSLGRKSGKSGDDYVFQLLK